MKRRPGQPALDLLEEAMHLLRRAPLGALVSYYIGALPFVLGLLYFWADMSRGAFAHEHAVASALTVTLLFIWMKSWQSVFCQHLRALAAQSAPPRWTIARAVRLVCVQAALQPFALFVRPLAALITMPYGWVFAFFQNVLVFGNGETASVRETFARAASQAKLWPKQNHFALSFITAFGFFVWLNVLAAMATVPALLKSFFGLETAFTRSMWSVTNSTFFAASCAGAYLCVNPLTHAFYALRCFHGESLQTGEDLRVEIRSFSRVSVVASLTLCFFLFSNSTLGVESNVPPKAPPAAEVSQLNDSIDQVLTRREYAWRMPREPIPKSERSWLGNFLDDAIKTVRAWLHPLKHWLRKIADWIDDYMRRHQPHENENGGNRTWLKSLRWLYIGLIAATVAVLGFMIWKRWKSERKTPFAFAQAMPAIPDLSSENVSADQLPEDGWLRLALEMAERGDLRLALRALYLASLAHLGARELIVLARHKSNREYERDLRRRARTRAELLDVFIENMNVFERAWYGLHDVSRETLARFQNNLEKIRAC